MMFSHVPVVIVVFVSASAKNPHTWTDSNCTLQPGVSYAGDYLKKLQLPSIARCEAACFSSDEARCTAFTFDPKKQECTLRSLDMQLSPVLNDNITSGFCSVGSGAAVQDDVRLILHRSQKVVSKTRPHYVCWNIDASRNREFFDRDLDVNKPFGAKLASYAKAISDPQGFSVLRFGGTGNDHLTYLFGNVTRCPTDPHHPSGHVWSPECMNKTWWDNLNSFAVAANARMIFGISDVPRKAGELFGPWDSQNAEAILKYSIAKGYKFYGFELGNEKDHIYNGSFEALDFLKLQQLVKTLYPDAKVRPRLIGPDSGMSHPWNDHITYLSDFLAATSRLNVQLGGLTHHEYIEISPSNFATPLMLDLTGAIAVAVNDTTSLLASKSTDLIAGEIGPHGGKSPPCNHSSMRWANFADSFWYADALGSKAQHGYSLFCRQDFIGIDYGLLDCSTGEPLPDYYIAVQWARSMGSRVLRPVLENLKSPGVRAYAHCGARSGVSVLIMNLNVTRSTHIHFDGFLGMGSRLEYHFAAADAVFGTGVALNGHVLKPVTPGELPEMSPNRVQANTPLELQRMSIAFVEFPDVQFPACSANLDDLDAENHIRSASPSEVVV